MESKYQILHRPRRNRRMPALREMVAETHLGVENLVMPLFIWDRNPKGGQEPQEIQSMPGIFRFNLNQCLSQIEAGLKVGLQSIALFPYIEMESRDPEAREALNEDGLVPRALREIKKRFPEVVVFSDIALDPYSTWGHDGIVIEGHVDNDATVEVLVKMAQLHANSGADFVSPSDMMDGRILQIRRGLDRIGRAQVGILSYAAKYASSFYGPFREALHSAPRFGDKKGYQMDFRNSREAIREALLDIQEGADILMVKPALAYLDILSQLQKRVNLPLAAYNVSGEYAMIKAASQQGWLNGEAAMVESLTAIRRAGAQIIFTYFAMEMAVKLQAE